MRAGAALTAEATDAETGIRNLTIQYLPPGGAWTILCTVAAAPYSCSWNTQGGPDGGYSLRAVATDNSGLTGISATVATTVANTFVVALTGPGDIQRGTVNLSATLHNPGSTLYTVRVEYSMAGTNKWSTLCQNLTAPYNCTWATGTFANDFFDLRAVAISGSTSTYSEAVTDVLVDNQAPTVTMSDPGTPLRGLRTFEAVAADAHSGVAQTQIQYARSGTTTWAPLCTVTVPQYSCRFDTTALTNAAYSFRAIATDEAGTRTTSAAVTSRVVDNTVASVPVEDPGAYLPATSLSLRQRTQRPASAASGSRQRRQEPTPGPRAAPGPRRPTPARGTRGARPTVSSIAPVPETGTYDSWAPPPPAAGPRPRRNPWGYRPATTTTPASPLDSAAATAAPAP